MSAAVPSPSVFRRAGARPAWLLLCAGLLLCACVLSLTVGAKPIALRVVVESLSGISHGTDGVIVLQGRVPRTLLGLMAGSALGLAGALIQALTRNPLADPGLLGVNAGASFAMVLCIALFASTSPAVLLPAAFAGALGATALIYLIGTERGAPADPARFVLAGVALAAVLGGFSSALTLFDAPAFDALRYWAAGSLDVRDLQRLRWALAPFAAGGLVAAALARPLNALALGDTLAQGLGVNPRRLQFAAVGAIALLCGAATAVAGPIAFVGLLIPQLARRLAGPDQRWLFAFSALLGPLLLLLADVLGRVLVAGELRVSIVTAFVGAPVLIALARREYGPAR